MIEQEIIDTIKTDIDLISLIESKGITLKKNGKGHVGLCPFHDDKTPSLSVNPSTNLWQCFGCGTGGDVIRFVELFDKVSFPEAIKRLSGGTPQLKRTDPEQSAKNSEKLTPKEEKLLERVVVYYQHTLTHDQNGLLYLTNERNITDKQSIEDFGAGYANGTLLNILPDDNDVLKSLKKIGILNSKGKEFFYNCVVFPLYNVNGTVTSLYGRNINDNNDITHLYLPGIRAGIVNRQACKRSQILILTESIIDALTLYDQGFKNVVPAYGVNGLIEDHLLFFNRKIKEIYIAFDADESGKKGAEKIAVQLKENNIMPYIIDLPVKDINIYFKRHTPEEFEILLKNTNPASLEQSEKVGTRKQSLYKETDQGFIVGYGDRQYQIKGIQRGSTHLKATIKVSRGIEQNQPFELSTIDLYSSRSCRWFAKLCGELFGASEELIREDIGKLLSLVESWQPEEQKAEIQKSSKEDQKAAMDFLNNPDMFEEILKDLETSGITGEETNKLVGYLAAVSRKLDDPLSVLVQSRSAAGKSTLQDAVLSLVPPEDYIKYTRITDQALFYKDEDSLVNKILAVEEEVGMGGAAYSIRNIQSAKKITVATTGKDTSTGKMKTEEYTVKGPVAVMITTTSADVEGETGSRFLFLTIDESSEMTEAIHNKQREAETLEGIIKQKKSETIARKHQAAQRLLKSIAVANPYTKYLSYPNQSLRTRRDHKKYLGLIRTIAFLYQYQKAIKTVDVDGDTLEYIYVSLDDIEKANTLANEVLGQTLDELAKPSRTLLNGICGMVKDVAKKENSPMEELYFTRRMIREYLNWTDWQIRAHIKQLEDLEYLHVRTGSCGKEYAYALNYNGQEEDDKCYLNLTPVSRIRELMLKETTRAS